MAFSNPGKFLLVEGEEMLDLKADGVSGTALDPATSAPTDSVVGTDNSTIRV
jgi:hypothetical protein